eukprot:g3840.t1
MTRMRPFLFGAAVSHMVSHQSQSRNATEDAAEQVPTSFDLEPEQTNSPIQSLLPLLAALLVGLAAGSGLRAPTADSPTEAVKDVQLSTTISSLPNAETLPKPTLVMQKATGKMQDVADKVDKALERSLERLSEVESKEEQVIRYDDKLAKMYTGLMESARGTGAKLQDVVKTLAPSSEKGAPSRVSVSVVKKIRDIGDMLDEAQADVYKEEWMSLKVRWIHFIRPEYYEKEAFNDGNGDKYVNAATRDSLTFYRLQMAVNIDRLEKAIENQKVREVEEDTNISDDQLRYTPLALQQPQIRDEVLVLQGPDKGKVGRIIWLGRENGDDLDSKVLSAVVKLEPNPVLGVSKSGGVREVKAYPYSWLVMTRGSDESYVQDLVLATVAAIVSCSLTYPLETLKERRERAVTADSA